MAEMSPEQRADRGKRLADAYHKRLKEGLAEPREEFLRRHQELRDVLEPLVEKTLAEGGHRRLVAMEPEIPKQIGPYRVLDVLGEGGMGTVYVAEQRQPIRRRVALKIIKLGMDSKEVLLRFEAERQALAMMEHNNIAKVFDAGTTDTGQPYFAMEYVKGESFTRYCDDQSLGLEERLELFCEVCSGVQHAHQKGVIHRDLTPRNVLVTVQDGKPTPKIIDFGIARATDHRLLEKTIFTQQGKFMGVPEYMSPEQAGLGALDIDTRSDVYTLGVLLYETLIGQLPFSAQELRSAGLMEMERKIREDDPPRPSTRMTAAPGGNTANVARQRGLDRSGLVRMLKGDLDWITMKALEKDRTRRYQTATELAQDIERYVQHEPVLARPPTMTYRAQKFLRRYRLQAAAAALIFGAVVTGGVTTLVMYLRADANLRLAEENFGDAESLSSYMLDEFREKLMTVGKLRLLRDAADRVVQYYADPEKQRLSDEGRYKMARGLDHLSAYFLDLGDLEQALRTSTQAADILADLVQADPQPVDWARELARNRLYRGTVIRDRGDLNRALAEHRDVLDELQPLVERAPEDPEVVSLLALTHYEIAGEQRHLGDSTAALADAELARDLRSALVGRDADNHLWQSDLARSHHNVGQILYSQGRLAPARVSYDAALEIRQQFAALDPTNTIWKEDLASSYADLGRLQYQQGDEAGASASYRAALDLRSWLADYDPVNAAWRDDLAGTYLRLGSFSRSETELQQALQNQREALRIRRELTGQDPSNASWKSDLADSHHGVGVALQRQDHLADALESYVDALEIREDLCGDDPANALWQGNLAKEHNNIGTVLHGQGDADGALQSYGEALSIELDLLAKDAADAYVKREVAGSFENLGRVLAETGELDQALQNLRDSVQLREELVALDDSNARWQLELAAGHLWLASLFNMRGEAVLPSLQSALAIQEGLVARHPANARFQRDLASTCHRIGVILGTQGDHAGALRNWTRVVELRRQLVAGDPDNITLVAALAAALGNVGGAQQRQGMLAEALESIRESLRVRDDPTVRRRFGDVAAAFAAALAEPAFRDDLQRGNLYAAARAAALAAGAGGNNVADTWRGRAIEWLGEDLRLRRARVAEIEAQLGAEDPLSEAARQLRAELRTHIDHFERVRTADPDLAGLRGTPAFDALFR